MKKLIEAGADVNDPVIHHHGGLERPILEAVYREDLEIVRYLLEHGAEIDYVSDWGITPLNMAMRIGNARVNKEMVLLLLFITISTIFTVQIHFILTLPKLNKQYGL